MGNHCASFFSRARPHVDDIIACCNDVKVVLDDDHRITQIHQPIELNH